MALTSSLFAGISGLTSFGNSIQIIGDNIANVNTVGYKASLTTFQDLLTQSISTQSGTAQVGRGTALSGINGDFTQGSFESTGNATDLSIGGNGFFILQDPNSSSLYYTRAGNFNFDKDGNLINPDGYIVQGWQMDANGEDVGTIGNVQLSSFTSPPVESSNITFVTNLDSDTTERAGVGTSMTYLATGNPKGVLSTAWDSSPTTTGDPNIAITAYDYQTSIKVYDSLGSTHDITVYFSKGANSVWEYLVTCNPSEDMRDDGTGTPMSSSAVYTNEAGLLGQGEITFNVGTGTITNLTFQQFDPSIAVPNNFLTPTSTLNPNVVDTDADGVNDAPENGTNKSGLFEIMPDFLGGTNTTMYVALDLGSAYSTASGSWQNDSLTTTQYATSSTTTYQSSNGYGAGELENLDVDVDGVITGRYSNGQVLSLFRVGLAKFLNNQGLYKQGGNLYRETRDSGQATYAKPGTNGLGGLTSNALEQSNVDMSTEFVKMITTQRGFQANSKIVTTVDAMLGEVINMKR
ncbi:MAG: flagellar hook protein FlgE [Desulfobacterales bacterium]|nr:flagellar hook protein FlgE [Desulfobacterales bacterium]